MSGEYETKRVDSIKESNEAHHGTSSVILGVMHSVVLAGVNYISQTSVKEILRGQLLGGGPYANMLFHILDRMKDSLRGDGAGPGNFWSFIFDPGAYQKHLVDRDYAERIHAYFTDLVRGINYDEYHLSQEHDLKVVDHKRFHRHEADIKEISYLYEHLYEYPANMGDGDIYKVDRYLYDNPIHNLESHGEHIDIVGEGGDYRLRNKYYSYIDLLREVLNEKYDFSELAAISRALLECDVYSSILQEGESYTGIDNGEALTNGSETLRLITENELSAKTFLLIHRDIIKFMIMSRVVYIDHAGLYKRFQSIYGEYVNSVLDIMASCLDAGSMSVQNYSDLNFVKRQFGPKDMYDLYLKLRSELAYISRLSYVDVYVRTVLKEKFVPLSLQAEDPFIFWDVVLREVADLDTDDLKEANEDLRTYPSYFVVESDDGRFVAAFISIKSGSMSIDSQPNQALLEGRHGVSQLVPILSLIHI